MSERTSSAGIFARTRKTRPPEPAADARVAPFGWLWDSKESNWRPKKTRGRVPDSQARGRSPRKKKSAKAAPRKVVRQPLAEVPDPVDVAVLDDVLAEDAEGWDPAPAWQEEPGEAPAATAEGPGPGSTMRADIKALIALTYTIPTEPLALLDPYCFGALTEDQTAAGVVDALTDIVCASPKVAAWAASAVGLRPWIKLGIALKPVAVHAVKHHFTRSVEVEVDREAMTYLVKKRDYSEYTAA